MKEIGQQFARLIFAALESLATIDRNELLSASSAFLSVAQAGDPDGLTMARSIAFRACDWAVWDSPETYKALQRAVDVFSMHCAVQEASLPGVCQKIGIDTTY